MSNKPRFRSRELALMALPVLGLGSVAWWFSSGGSLARLRGVPSGLDTGPPRLLVQKLEPLQVSSLEVSQGFVWARTITLWEGGHSPLVTQPTETMGKYFHINADVFYRRHGGWLKSRSPDGMSMVNEGGSSDFQSFGGFISKGTVQVRVRLNGIPRDAREIRLRGVCTASHLYTGSAFSRVTPGKEWMFFGKQCQFLLKSQPFDWPIKKFNEEWPHPQVSRTPNLQLVGAHWFYTPYVYDVALHLRDPKGISAANRRGDIFAQNFSLQDGNGKEVVLYDTSSPKIRISTNTMTVRDPSTLNPKLPANERVATLRIGAEPRGGWGKVKGPLHLRAQISDWVNWPTSIDVKMNLEHGELRDIASKVSQP